ncbi:MAG: glucosaminidase domain-containing protein [Magnetospirillum sp.]|nr:glucosaminidase domain-containing protein [Magnetospirillum sp.]
MVLHGAVPPVKVASQAAASSVNEAAILSGEDVASAARLDRALDRLGYRLDSVANGGADVPPLFLAHIPGDIDDLPDTDTKKTVFLRVMLPLVLAVDEEIAAERSRLLDIMNRKANRLHVPASDQIWLEGLARRYDVESGNLRKLLARVDVVPASLALAQSAEESGWGTSKLVRRSQNLFGHTVELSADSTGMRNFSTLYEAVRAYVHNLNTHKAYEDLRRARASLRAHGAQPDGYSLVSALSSYSERGDAYVSTIRALIRRNDLVRYDQARLGRALPSRLASAS